MVSSKIDFPFRAVWPDDCIIIIIIIQSLAIYNNDNLAGYKKDKVSTKVRQILNKKCPKAYKILPKWRINAKSGHTGSE